MSSEPHTGDESGTNQAEKQASKNKRTWSSVWCLLLGHDYVDHTKYRLESDTGRAVYGDLCPRCGHFEVVDDGKAQFEDPMPTDVGEFLENNVA